mmetsp:Transcript_36675/g.57586  ORF Transcript_36675/g.57586 Transcript_36675/m.57586 type:complete len:254 (-) Transcript_36675:78-839(-)
MDGKRKKVRLLFLILTWVGWLGLDLSFFFGTVETQKSFTVKRVFHYKDEPLHTTTTTTKRDTGNNTSGSNENNKLEKLSSTVANDVKQLSDETERMKKRVDVLQGELQDKKKIYSSLDSGSKETKNELQQNHRKSEAAAYQTRRKRAFLLFQEERMRRLLSDGKAIKKSPLSTLTPQTLMAGRENLHAITQQLYKYEEILQTDLSQLNNRCLEQYLEENEFESLFAMTKEEFLNLPEWMQHCRKKQLHLTVDL